MASAARTQDRRPADEDVGILIAKSRRILWIRIARRLDAIGESVYAWRMIRELALKGPRLQRDLADAIAQHPTGVCRLVDDLERQGLLRRRRDPTDRRKIWVALTPKGKGRHALLLPEVTSAIQDLLRPLGAAERRTLRTLLEKVVNAGQLDLDAG